MHLISFLGWPRNWVSLPWSYVTIESELRIPTAFSLHPSAFGNNFVSLLAPQRRWGTKWTDFDCSKPNWKSGGQVTLSLEGGKRGVFTWWIFHIGIGFKRLVMGILGDVQSLRNNKHSEVKHDQISNKTPVTNWNQSRWIIASRNQYWPIFYGVHIGWYCTKFFFFFFGFAARNVSSEWDRWIGHVETGERNGDGDSQKPICFQTSAYKAGDDSWIKKRHRFVKPRYHIRLCNPKRPTTYTSQWRVVESRPNIPPLLSAERWAKWSKVELTCFTALHPDWQLYPSTRLRRVGQKLWKAVLVQFVFKGWTAYGINCSVDAGALRAKASWLLGLDGLTSRAVFVLIHLARAPHASAITRSNNIATIVKQLCPARNHYSRTSIFLIASKLRIPYLQPLFLPLESREYNLTAL